MVKKVGLERGSAGRLARVGRKMVKAARRPNFGEVGRGPFSATFSQEHRYMLFDFEPVLDGLLSTSTRPTSNTTMWLGRNSFAHTRFVELFRFLVGSGEGRTSAVLSVEKLTCKVPRDLGDVGEISFDGVLYFFDCGRM